MAVYMLQNITSWVTLTQHKILHDFGAFPASGPKLPRPGILWPTDFILKKSVLAPHPKTPKFVTG